MIVYCGTSALVKRYIREAEKRRGQDAAEQVEAVATSRIAWVEFHAAVARKAREAPPDASAVEAAKRALADDWSHYLKMEIDQNVVEKAGEFADAFALRGYDAVHLAAAHRVMKQTDDSVLFACFDLRLCRVAALLDMAVLVLGSD